MPEPQWACVHTHPQAEHWAQSNLEQRGYRTWLPLVVVKRRDRAVRTIFHDVRVPAFSRYVFLQHTPGSPWSPIRYTEGVNDVVRMGMQPAYASDMAIEAIRKALEAGEDEKDTDRRPWEQWPVGASVRLMMGSPGIDGIVLRSDDRLVTISAIMLGALREITVPADRLRMRDDA